MTDPRIELDRATERMRNALDRQERAFRNLQITIGFFFLLVLLNLAVMTWRLMSR